MEEPDFILFASDATLVGIAGAALLTMSVATFLGERAKVDADYVAALATVHNFVADGYASGSMGTGFAVDDPPMGVRQLRGAIAQFKALRGFGVASDSAYRRAVTTWYTSGALKKDAKEIKDFADRAAR